jgi:pilus assembly protein TadC
MWNLIIYFQVRDPMPAVYFFLIDVSMNAIQTGATAAACSAIAQAIRSASNFCDYVILFHVLTLLYGSLLTVIIINQLPPLTIDPLL